MVHDIGGKANSRKLAKAAACYANSAVRRLGYLLDHFGFEKPSQSLERFARAAKSMKPLDPSVRPLIEEMEAAQEKDNKWLLIINEPVEIDV